MGEILHANLWGPNPPGADEWLAENLMHLNLDVDSWTDDEERAERAYQERPPWAKHCGNTFAPDPYCPSPSRFGLNMKWHLSRSRADGDQHLDYLADERSVYYTNLPESQRKLPLIRHQSSTPHSITVAVNAYAEDYSNLVYEVEVRHPSEAWKKGKKVAPPTSSMLFVCGDLTAGTTYIFRTHAGVARGSGFQWGPYSREDALSTSDRRMSASPPEEQAATY